MNFLYPLTRFHPTIVSLYRFLCVIFNIIVIGCLGRGFFFLGVPCLWPISFFSLLFCHFWALRSDRKQAIELKILSRWRL